MRPGSKRVGVGGRLRRCVAAFLGKPLGCRVTAHMGSGLEWRWAMSLKRFIMWMCLAMFVIGTVCICARPVPLLPGGGGVYLGAALVVVTTVLLSDDGEVHIWPTATLMDAMCNVFIVDAPSQHICKIQPDGE